MSDHNKKRGNRRDGKRVREMDPMHALIPYLMPNRCDSEVYINQTVDVTNLCAYLKTKADPENRYKPTIFHLFVAAVAKTVTHRPLLNRFIAGKRCYERSHISLSFVAKRQFTDHSEESIMILHTNDNTTLDEISKKIVGEVRQARETGQNSTDKLLDTFAKAPRWFMNLFMWVYKKLDYYGKAPRSLTDNDPNFTTVLLSNLGSIKCGAIYHHLNNYGTNSILITIGQIYKTEVIDQRGNREVRDVLDLGITLDERIADGFYFAKSVKLLQHFIENPELLEAPLKEKNFNYEY